MKITSLSNISEIKEISIKSINTRILVELLLLALNDWPRSIDSLSEFEGELKILLCEQSIIDISKIEHYLKSVDMISNAWYVESFTFLLELFKKYDYGITFNEIINDITNRLNYEI